MRLQRVILQLDVVVKELTADIAGHVAGPVPGQVCLACALLAAHGTRQAQVTSMDFQMTIEMAFLCKALATNATCMRFCVSWNS